MDSSKPVNIFIKEKPVMALLAIHKSYSDIYPSKVSKKIDSTYSHTVNIITKMEENNIVETRKEGRKRILTLTDRGEAYSNTLLQLMEIDGNGVNFSNPGESLDFLNDDDDDDNSGPDDSESGEGGQLARQL